MSTDGHQPDRREQEQAVKSLRLAPNVGYLYAHDTFAYRLEGLGPPKEYQTQMPEFYLKAVYADPFYTLFMSSSF